MIALPAYVPPLAIGDVVPDASFRDQYDRARSWSSWPGSVLVVTFVYTRCPDHTACPLVSAKFAALQRRLAGTPAHLIELTLDPVHDTPLVLRRYGATLGVDERRWSLLTGTPRTMRAVAERFDAVSGADADATSAHSDDVVVIGADGRISDRIGGNSWRPEGVAALVRSRASLASNPWERLVLALGQGVGALCSLGAAGLPLGLVVLLFAGLLGIGAAIARHHVRMPGAR